MLGRKSLVAEIYDELVRSNFKYLTPSSWMPYSKVCCSCIRFSKIHQPCSNKCWQHNGLLPLGHTNMRLTVSNWAHSIPINSHCCITVLLPVVSVEEKKEQTVAALNSARSKIRNEISDLNERLKQTREAIGKFREEISKLEGPEEKIETWKEQLNETWLCFWLLLSCVPTVFSCGLLHVQYLWMDKWHSCYSVRCGGWTEENVVDTNIKSQIKLFIEEWKSLFYHKGLNVVTCHHDRTHVIVKNSA